MWLILKGDDKMASMRSQLGPFSGKGSHILVERLKADVLAVTLSYIQMNVAIEVGII